MAGDAEALVTGVSFASTVVGRQLGGRELGVTVGFAEFGEAVGPFFPFPLP